MSNVEEIVRLSEKANAVINQGIAAGWVLGGINALADVAIVEKAAGAKMIVACLLVILASQGVVAAITWLRLRKIWAQRRQVFDEMIGHGA